MRLHATHGTARARGEHGISLIELLIAITISSILLVPLGEGIYFGLHSTADTQTRLGESNSANLLSAYFSADVQGASGAATNTSESPLVCGAGAGLVDLLLTAPNGTSVSYYRGTGATAGVLYRRTCAAGAPISNTHVARNLAGAPTYTCTLTPTCSLTVVQSDAGGHNVYTTNLQASRRGT